MKIPKKTFLDIQANKNTIFNDFDCQVNFFKTNEFKITSRLEFKKITIFNINQNDDSYEVILFTNKSIDHKDPSFFVHKSVIEEVKEFFSFYNTISKNCTKKNHKIMP